MASMGGSGLYRCLHFSGVNHPAHALQVTGGGRIVTWRLQGEWQTVDVLASDVIITRG
jgi:hypothetical protein